MPQLLIIIFFCVFVYGCSVGRTTEDNRYNIKDQKDNLELLASAKDYYLFGQYQDALNTALPLARQNIPEAQYLVGYLYFIGEDVKRDMTLGRQWIEQAADAGHRIAIEALVMIDYGLTPDGKCAPRQEQLPGAEAVSNPEKMVNKPVDKQLDVVKSNTDLQIQNHIPVQVTPATDNAPTANDNLNVTLKKYTVQLISSPKIDSIHQFMRSLVSSHPELAGELFIFHNTVENQVVYAAGYGSFMSYSQARRGLAIISPLLPAESPWIKPLKNSTFISMYH